MLPRVDAHYAMRDARVCACCAMSYPRATAPLCADGALRRPRLLAPLRERAASRWLIQLCPRVLRSCQHAARAARKSAAWRVRAFCRLRAAR